MMAHVNGNIGGEKEGPGEGGATENGAGDRPAPRQGWGRGSPQRSHRPFAMETGTIPFTASDSSAAQPEPEPDDYIVTHGYNGTEWVTSITREWDDPESARKHCLRCPKSDCYVSRRGACNIIVFGYLDDESARTFARAGSAAAEGTAVEVASVTGGFRLPPPSR